MRTHLSVSAAPDTSITLLEKFMHSVPETGVLDFVVFVFTEGCQTSNYPIWVAELKAREYHDSRVFAIYDHEDVAMPGALVGSSNSSAFALAAASPAGPRPAPSAPASPAGRASVKSRASLLFGGFGGKKSEEEAKWGAREAEARTMVLRQFPHATMIPRQEEEPLYCCLQKVVAKLLNTEDADELETLVAPAPPRCGGGQKANNVMFCPSQEKSHTVILGGVRQCF